MMTNLGGCRENRFHFGAKGIFLLLALLLVPADLFSQWNDGSIEKVCRDPVLANLFQDSYRSIARNLDSAVYYCEKGIRQAESVRNKPAVCLGYSLLARIHLLTPDYARALEYYDQAFNMEERLHVPELDAYLQYVRAVRNMMMGKQREAIEGTIRALMVYEKLRDTAGMISLYKFIGLLYLDLGEKTDLDKARRNFSKTLELQARQKDHSRVSSVFINIGTVFMRQDEFDSAYHYFLKAIWYDTKYQNQIWLAADYMNMGELKLARGEYDSAEYYMSRAGQYFTHPNDKALYYISLGKVKQQRKDYTKAMAYFTEAYQVVLKSDNQAALGKAISEMVKTAELQHDPSTALQYLKEYMTLKDTLSKSENIPAISLLEIQRQHDLKTNQMEVEKEKIALASQRKSSYLFFLGILILLLVMISVVIIYFLRLRQRAISMEKAELDKTLEFRNRELALQVMNLMKRNEFIIETSRRLIDIPSDKPAEEMKTEVIKIAKSLQDQTDREI